MNDAGSRRLFARLLAGAAALLLLALPAQGRRSWEVSDVAGLNDVMTQLMPADEIVLAPGVYNLTRELRFSVPYVTIRGATGVREDVVLAGPGMNTYVEGLAEAIQAKAGWLTGLFVPNDTDKLNEVVSLALEALQEE